jgi:hypothetical protein
VRARSDLYLQSDIEDLDLVGARCASVENRFDCSVSIVFANRGEGSESETFLFYHRNVVDIFAIGVLKCLSTSWCKYFVVIP